jgi:DNA-binding response OmpR family regulator
MANKGAPANARPREPRASMSSALPLKVFIAEDSTAVAEMLTALVSEPGRIEVVGVAESGSAAVESVTRIRPDVVILDLQLKTGSGTDVIRALRANKSLAATRIIVISNHVSPNLKSGCLDLGADDYFDKLKELPALLAKLAELACARG